MAWEAFREGQPLRKLSLTVNAGNGEVFRFRAREAPPAPLPDPHVSREQALAAAVAELQKVHQRPFTVENLIAHLGRLCYARPVGYPVWSVVFDAVDDDGDMAGHAYSVDGITGELMRFPAPRKPERPGGGQAKDETPEKAAERQQAARVAAAKFLGVEPAKLQSVSGPGPAREYRFDLPKGATWQAILWVKRHPVCVTRGMFHREPVKLRRKVGQAGATEAARRFAAKHWPELGELGPATSVKETQAGAGSRWHVVWELDDEEGLPGSLAIGIDAANGAVRYFDAR
jgi:hypothetical protein